MLPDVIYTQNPYDECNYTTSVHPFFYTRNLKKYTDKLVYIPWFTMHNCDTDDGKMYQTMDYFCTIPGVVLADEVWLPSQQTKGAYIKKLTEFAGEDTRATWEEKIIVRKIPASKENTRSIYENQQVKQEFCLKTQRIKRNRLCYTIFLQSLCFRKQKKR